MLVEYVKAQTSSHWCGEKVWRGGGSSNVVLVLTLTFPLETKQNRPTILSIRRKQFLTSRSRQSLEWRLN
ncbi:hypothetical protein TNCV_1010281 [Trichonephila clavipes]|nr:hypothetical protein TNCV_1010281 [Trichonephila clavipes]